MNRDTPIIIVSPSAHYPSHNWPISAALTRALRRQGQDVRIITFSTGVEPVPPDLAEIVKPVFARMPPGWRGAADGKWQQRRFGGVTNIIETLACLFSALRATRRQPGTVLHFIGGSYWIVILAALCFPTRRFVYSLYGGIMSGPATGLKAVIRKPLKQLLRRATDTDRLDFTCENEFLHAEIARLISNHIHLVPYAIADDEELPTRAAARQRLKLPPEAKILLFFGTHRREKDYATALRGALMLPVPPLALFVGKVISDNDPRQVVALCHYPNAHIVNEFVPEEMAPFYFAAADAVVLPYEADFARGSGVLIECCRYLRPMLATGTPYLSSFLKQYPCGVSYVAGNSTSFAAAIAELLADPARHQAALEQARRAHSWTTVAGQYIAIYDRSA
jgi:glycosyltransferase involved in cell wall biosynthesis